MLREYDGRKPDVHPSAFVAGESLVIGRVTVSENASIWPGCVIRADVEEIMIGAGTNLQDGVLVHPNREKPVIIGKNVTVGHGAVIHGCRIGDNCLIGMGAIILDGAVVEDNTIVGAGALVPENHTIREGNLVLGVPAKTARRLTKEDLEHISLSAREYVQLAAAHREKIDADA